VQNCENRIEHGVHLQIRWLIADCRIYAERADADTLVLYIDSVRRSDEGQYSCESDFNGQLATQHALLTVYGRLIHCHITG